MNCEAIGQQEIDKYKYIIEKTIPALKQLIAAEECHLNTLKAAKITVMPTAKNKPRKGKEEIIIDHKSDYEKLLRNNLNYTKAIRKIVRRMDEPYKDVLLAFYFGGNHERKSEIVFCMDNNISRSTMNRMKKKAKIELGKIILGIGNE